MHTSEVAGGLESSRCISFSSHRWLRDIRHGYAILSRRAMTKRISETRMTTLFDIMYPELRDVKITKSGERAKTHAPVLSITTLLRTP